jgi:hypothetical protein
MATNYIAVQPGTGFPTISMRVLGITGNLVVPSIQNLTVNNSNDVFTWTQLNEGSKLQVATTSTNSISTTVVVEESTFFGNASATSGSADKLGLLGLSDQKTKVEIRTTLGSKVFVANAYVTGLAPTISADQPVWTTPVTFTVSGEYTTI